MNSNQTTYAGSPATDCNSSLPDGFMPALNTLQAADYTGLLRHVGEIVLKLSVLLNEQRLDPPHEFGGLQQRGLSFGSKFVIRVVPTWRSQIQPTHPPAGSTLNGGNWAGFRLSAFIDKAWKAWKAEVPVTTSDAMSILRSFRGLKNRETLSRHNGTMNDAGGSAITQRNFLMKKQLALASLVAIFTLSACGEQQDGAVQAPTATGMKSEAGIETAMKSEMKADPSNPYMASEMDMHDKMMAAKGADAAETWTRKMIEHHKGALTMSEVALKETDDAMVRKMAQETIDMQTKDIAELQKWLTDKGSTRQ